MIDSDDNMVTAPPAPPAVIRALKHVRLHYSEVVMVVFQRDNRWAYLGQDFDGPTFDDRIDVGILEDAVYGIEQFPAVFEVVPPEART